MTSRRLNSESLSIGTIIDFIDYRLFSVQLLYGDMIELRICIYPVSKFR